jgi:hypothetical protein
MTKKADFNAEEWSKVVEAPLLAGMRVVAADRGGSIRETVAVARVYAEARQRHADNELLDELVASPPALERQQVRSADELGPKVTASLHEALEILGQKASQEEIDAYRNFVMDVAEAAAKAHKEGGFIGIGGKEVSEKEQAALNEIQAALGE